MLRKLISKRSGFTLVEIIVAMVIFAIMSTMIFQILQLSSKARMENNAYGEELAAQEEQLAKVEKKATDFQNKTDDYSLTFKKADGTEIGEVKLAYEIKDPSGSTSAEGINYFVSPVKYDGKITNSSGGGGGEGSSGGSGGGAAGGNSGISSVSLSSLFDVRLTASRGMDHVDIISVEKKGTASAGAAVRYVFKTNASSDGMNPQDRGFAEYKLYFYMKGQIDPIKSATKYVYEQPNGTSYEYTKDIPMAANIIATGYCDSEGTPISYSNEKPTVRNTGTNCVTVSVAMGYEGAHLTGDNYAGVGFTSDPTVFYVDFEEDPQITSASFGANGVANGTGHRYEKYTNMNVSGTAYQNNYTYGAYHGWITDPDADGGYIWRSLSGNIITADSDGYIVEIS